MSKEEEEKTLSKQEMKREIGEIDSMTLALMDTPPVKLPTHKHPLYLSSRFICVGFCDGCLKQGPMKEGYRCNDSECNHVWFHKECAESPPLLFNDYLHRQHPLILSKFTDYSAKCNNCGQKSGYDGRHSSGGYRCSLCDFEVDLACARKPQPLETRHSMFHDHPLVHMVKRGKTLIYCGVCKTLIMDKYLSKCSVKFHEDCINLEPEVNHLYHSKHPLMLLKSGSLSDDVRKNCVLCGKEPDQQRQVLLYHCSICNFSLCLFCTSNPPRLVVQHGKTHEHQLFLMPSHISFTCNVCGMQGDQSPYLCLQCGFSVHRICIDLPRVININRHDHRVSFVHQLGPGYSSCGVCHKNIDRYFGGYACSICPNYAVHSQCAVRRDVWEGIELENIPEEIEDIAPFVLVGDNLIKHFSHEEHNLRFNKSTSFHDENTRCKACVRPLYADQVYECEQCDFALHEKCANLPRKKRLVHSNKPFTLITTHVDSSNRFWCSCCGIVSNGFRYVSGDVTLDICCGLFSEPFMHDGHMHPLYCETKYAYSSKCTACFEDTGDNVLHCHTCEFRLHVRCANMPISMKSKHDDHPLFLCYGDKASGKYWCDICEKETDPAKWFYTCSHCGVTLHVKCVLGDFSHLIGCIIEEIKVEFEVVSNNRNSCRPFCNICQSRCKAPNILKFGDRLNEYICSFGCLTVFEFNRQ